MRSLRGYWSPLNRWRRWRDRRRHNPVCSAAGWPCPIRCQEWPGPSGFGPDLRTWMRQPRDEERERREQEARWLVARDGTYDGPPLVEQERDGEWPIARPLEWP